ncbi:peptidoglycan recognition protein family protein [Actinoplanes aureus]|uniref:Peptidoglycan recognition protein n=1 Tax=Actinoplanes aureus TaxID=2792083 RepID=A0A931C4H1_9ACTN|nr:N-acetylmuramoyl-L-alanine amidase [Actinoplanes aureus]MBG0560288.1 peptidoglycan recognition protein [Actinoplanes aureus]
MRRNRLVVRLVLAAAVLAGSQSLLTVPSRSLPRSQAAEPLVQTFRFDQAAATRDARLISARSAALRTAELPSRRTAPFSLLGVSWSDPRAVAAGAIEVRTRSIGTGRWTSWQLLETDNPDASGGSGGPAVRGASDPLWVGPSDGVQARMVATDGGPVPDGLRVDLINPEASSTATPRLDLVAARTGGKRAPGLPARPVPKMVSRAGWGANEMLVKETPSYTGPIQVVFVHHTATGNGYSCGQSASIVRGIEAYQVKSKGWNDIGYNFLVDKCGRIFEGRRGGVHRSVLGAHTLGFNDNSSAIAVIGNFGGIGIPAAARASVAQLAAYKLGAWGSPPAGRVRLTSGGSDRYPAGKPAVLNRISGHRDTGRTECPGNSLYAQLPAIRTIAGGAPAGLRYQSLGGATAYAGRYYSRGLLQPLWNLSTPTRMLDRFEVWLDGRLLAGAPAWHRRSRVRLTPGAHTVAVKAVHLSGRTSVTSERIIADPVPPSLAAPQVSLRVGTLSNTVPVRLGWTTTDAGGVRSVRVTGTTRTVLGGTARALDGSARLGEAGAWTVTAADRAGNVRSASVTRTPMMLPEAGARRTGTWRTLRDPGFLGSEALTASAGRASLSWTFTGRSAALVVGRTATSGRVRIFLDGRDQGVVDLRSATATYRQAVWTRMWRDSGRHTVRVQVEGTAGRPSVMLDGLAYLR